MGSGPSLVEDLERSSLRSEQPSQLVKHILRCDWLAVLARIDSHPREAKAQLTMSLYGQSRTRITPLHLICALNPPVNVVQAIIDRDAGQSATIFIANDTNRKAENDLLATHGDDFSKGTWKTDSSLTVKSWSKRFVLGPNTRSDPTLKPTLSKVYSRRAILRSQASSRKLTSRSQRFTRSVSSRFSPTQQPSARNVTAEIDDINDIFGDYSSAHFEEHGLLDSAESEIDFYKCRGSLACMDEGISVESTIDEDYDEESSFRMNGQLDFPRANPASRRSGERQGRLTRRLSERSFCGGINAVVDPSSSHWLPIHVACLFRASPDVLLVLIRACPWTTKVMNGMGMLPVHIVCAGIEEPPPPFFLETTANPRMEWNPADCLHLLLRGFPDSIFMRSSNADDMTPGEYVDGNFLPGQEKNNIMNLLLYPVDSFTPIDSLGTSPKVHSIRYDEGESNHKSREPNAGRPTRLWYHISRRAWRLALIRIARAPDEALIWTMIDDKSSAGAACYRLPLHKACTMQPPLAVVEALVNAYPKSVKAREKFAMLPLHIACSFRADASVINLLINKYPCALKAVDAWGRLPLHAAAVSGATQEVLHLLLEGHPSAARHIDKKGRLAKDCVRMSDGRDKDILLSPVLR